VVLPGSNVGITLTLGIAHIVLGFLISNGWLLNGVHTHEVKEFERYHRASMNVSLLAIMLCILSVGFVLELAKREAKQVSKYFSLLVPRILNSLSSLLLFSLICSWVLLLGGIKQSPLVSLLTISPVLLHIQLFGVEINYASMAEVIEKNHPTMEVGRVRYHCVIGRCVVTALDWLPVALILLCVTLGEVYVADLNRMLVGDKLEAISKTTWFSELYYLIFFFSVLAAWLGVMPRKWYGAISAWVSKCYFGGSAVKTN